LNLTVTETLYLLFSPILSSNPSPLHCHCILSHCSDLEFALTLSIDWVALSFVQKPEDILELRALAGPNVKVRGT
jgi:hypothetical protein